jgi:hypothetical protein
MTEKFETEPCTICGQFQAHADTCPAAPTWRPEVNWASEGFPCPSCGRPYAHPDEADRCVCQVPEACLLCHRAGVPGVAENGLCDDCLTRIEEDAERYEWNEAQKTFDQGGPWY